MLGHDNPQPQEMILKGSVEGKTYVGPGPSPAGADDREVVSFDGQVLILKWVDPEIAGRYGIMVLARCGWLPEGVALAAAREAGNMVDLDSNPTKLIEIVEIGKQLLMTHGALIASDMAKYFAIIPAIFLAFYPQLGARPRAAARGFTLSVLSDLVTVLSFLLKAVGSAPSPARMLLPPFRARTPHIV
jgi:hypothetical protein